MIGNDQLRSIDYDYSWNDDLDYDKLQLIDYECLRLIDYDNDYSSLINYDCDIVDEMSTSGAMYPCVPTLAWGLFLLKHWEFILQSEYS